VTVSDCKKEKKEKKNRNEYDATTQTAKPSEMLVFGDLNRLNKKKMNKEMQKVPC